MALVVVDPQRKFTLDLPDWEARMASAVENINEFTKVFREFGAPVIFIAFEGESHCNYQGNDGDEWLPGIETSASDIIVRKQNMNCFKGTDLEKILRENGIDCAVYTGMLTEFCVISTYFGSSERDVFPYLGKDALIPYYEEGNRSAQVVCNTLDIPTIRRFLSGEQPPMVIDF